jgi:hypothetical protein
VRANDTGGNLRATMEAVKAEDEAASWKKKGWRSEGTIGEASPIFSLPCLAQVFATTPNLSTTSAYPPTPISWHHARNNGDIRTLSRLDSGPSHCRCGGGQLASSIGGHGLYARQDCIREGYLR